MKKSFWITISIIALLLAITFYLIIKPQPEKLLPEKKIKVAIVLDDWGYNMRNIRLLESIDAALTISILPNLQFSEDIAGRIHSYKNREIILHMPMEPEDKTLRLEKNTLLTSMNDKEILAILNKALEGVPYAKGVSNHMGSKATQDRRLIRVVMKGLKARKLFFLDSLSTPKTVCEKEARDSGVRFIRRNVFLDNISDKDYIVSQIDELIETARENGSAIGIGHDRKLTLQVIKEKADSLKESNIEFVFASEL